MEHSIQEAPYEGVKPRGIRRELNPDLNPPRSRPGPELYLLLASSEGSRILWKMSTPICRTTAKGVATARNRDSSVAAATMPAAVAAPQGTHAAAPLMLRAMRGESVERPPVWMMRQAGRYMKVYQDLVKKYPTFRERSERVDLSVSYHG
jgi:hypothetical protein